MQCLLCGQPAKSIAPINQAATAIACVDCGEWEASGHATTTLATLADHTRLQALRFAQVNSVLGRRPFIHGLS